MGEKSNISWTDDTYNPWRGCSKVSPGCAYCYAERLVTTRLKGKWGKGAPRVPASLGTLRLPLRWNQQAWICDECGAAHCVPGSICMTAGCYCETKHRRRVFMGSLMDVFDPEVPVEHLANALVVIWQCPALDFQLLTKRPELWRSRVQAAHDYLARAICQPGWSSAMPSRVRHPAAAIWLSEWLDGVAPKNVWMGASAENQDTFEQRVLQLVEIPALVRFLSCEPLLEQINLHFDTSSFRIWGKGLVHWVIVGGESGPHPRIPRIYGTSAIVDIAQQCGKAGVPCFVKQDTAQRPGRQGLIPDNIWAIKEFPKSVQR